MKNILVVSALIVVFGLNIFAQEKEDCPKIDVSGGGVVNAGEAMTFTARVENYDLSKVSFNWTVSSGEILDGQGTSSIKVLQKDYDENLTAIVEIQGLPEGCPATDSETGTPYDPPNALLFDEFSISELRIDKARLDYLVIELGNNPNANTSITEYFKPKTPKRIINRKIQKITDYLVSQKKLEKDKFTISTAFSDEGNWTKFWIIPPGARFPEP